MSYVVRTKGRCFVVYPKSVPKHYSLGTHRRQKIEPGTHHMLAAASWERKLPFTVLGRRQHGSICKV